MQRTPSLRIFICIGYPRSGTSTLYTAISELPDIATSNCKEIDFFSLHFGRGKDWYLKQFFSTRTKETKRAMVDFSVNYMCSLPTVHSNTKTYNICGIMLCVRKPSEFAISLLRFAQHRGIKFNSLNDFINTPLGTITGPHPGASDPYNSERVGFYLDMPTFVNSVRSLFSSANLLIIPLENLSDIGMSRAILNFIDSESDELALRVINKGGEPVFRIINRLLPYISGWMRRNGLGAIIGWAKKRDLVSRLFLKSSGKNGMENDLEQQVKSYCVDLDIKYIKWVEDALPTKIKAQ